MTSKNPRVLRKAHSYGLVNTVGWIRLTHTRVHGVLWDTCFLLPFFARSQLRKVPFTSLHLDLCFLVIRSLPSPRLISVNSRGKSVVEEAQQLLQPLLPSDWIERLLFFFSRPRSSCLMRLVTITPTGVPHLCRLRGKYRARCYSGGGGVSRGSGFGDCFDGVSGAATLTLCRWSSVTHVLICFKISLPFPISSWGLFWENLENYHAFLLLLVSQIRLRSSAG